MGFTVPEHAGYAASKRASFRRCFFDACHRSYWACMPIQSSGLVPRASERRKAISAEIPALPFRMRESATRVIPKCLAAAVTGTLPKYSLSTFPGWGGLNIRIKHLSDNLDSPPKWHRRPQRRMSDANCHSHRPTSGLLNHLATYVVSSWERSCPEL